MAVGVLACIFNRAGCKLETNADVVVFLCELCSRINNNNLMYKYIYIYIYTYVYRRLGGEFRREIVSFGSSVRARGLVA